MKQGEISKKRQLGGGKEAFHDTQRLSKGVIKRFSKFSESSDCTTATEVDFKQICFGLVQKGTLKCD